MGSPRHVAEIDLVSMVDQAGADTCEQIVDYFIRRFLRVGLTSADRDSLVAFARERLGDGKIDVHGEQTETDLRDLLHLVLSAPEYQLS